MVSMYRATKGIPAVFPSHERLSLSSFLLLHNATAEQAFAFNGSAYHIMASHDQISIRVKTFFMDLYVSREGIHPPL